MITPGPWLMTERLSGSENHAGWRIGPEEGKTVAEVYPGSSEPTEEAIGNARLIAAAPELLDALRRIYRWAFRDERRLKKIGITMQTKMDDLNAAAVAILKTEGK